MSAEDQTPIDNELSTLQAKIDKVEDKVEKLEAAEPNENKEEYARWDKKMEQLRTKEEQLRTKEEQLRAEKILLLEMRKQQQAQQDDSKVATLLLGVQKLLEVENKKLQDKLEPLYADFNRKRKRELDPWERDSLRTKKRDPQFKNNLIQFYERRASSTELFCQVLNRAYPSTNVIGAHIWKHETKGVGLESFGLAEGNIDSVRNGLLLAKGLEDAFDHKRVCFLYNFIANKFVLHVADPTLKGELVAPSTSQTFADIDGKPLQHKEGNLPFRRLLSWHAYLTLDKFGQRDRFKPYHRLSESDKGFAFPEDVVRMSGMVRDGADASEDEDKREGDE